MVSPTAKDKGVKRSHLVWQHYLNSFSRGKKIFVKNKITNTIFQTSTENVSVSKNIYEIEFKISKDDVFLYKCLLNKAKKLDEAEEKILNELVAFLNNDLSCFCHDPILLSMFQIIIPKTIDEKSLQRNQEELFTFYEGNFIALYDLLLNNDSSFYNDKLSNRELMAQGYLAGITLKTSNFFQKKAIDLMSRTLNELGAEEFTREIRESFKTHQKLMEKELEEEFHFSNENSFMSYYFITFFLTQAFRISKVLDSLCITEKKFPSQFEKYKGKFNFKNIAILIIHYQIYRLGLNLIFDGYKIVFIKNCSGKDFITSDCPIVNIFGLFKNAIEMQKDELEFYYPLSPKLAILFSSRSCYKDTDTINASEKDVIIYNDMIFKMSSVFVYSDDKILLESL